MEQFHEAKMISTYSKITEFQNFNFGKYQKFKIGKIFILATFGQPKSHFSLKIHNSTRVQTLNAQVPLAKF